MKHIFDVEIAREYGVNCAVIMENMFFWIEKNRANATNFYDGKYWTFNSKKALTELFPYLTQMKAFLSKETIINLLLIKQLGMLLLTLVYRFLKIPTPISENSEIEKQIFRDQYHI